MENSDVKAYRRKIERSYWIAVIHTDNWNKDDRIVKLAEKPLTRYILVSRPVYKRGDMDMCIMLCLVFLKQ